MIVSRARLKRNKFLHTGILECVFSMGGVLAVKFSENLRPKLSYKLAEITFSIFKVRIQRILELP